MSKKNKKFQKFQTFYEDEDEENFFNKESKYEKIKERKLQLALKTKDIDALMDYDDDEDDLWDEDDYRR